MIDPNKQAIHIPTNPKPSRLERWSNILRGVIDVLLFMLCGIHTVLYSNLEPWNDVWFVLYIICLFRIVDWDKKSI